MKRRLASTTTAALILAFCFTAAHLQAFALLGPFADWMDVTNDFRQPGDIGGPVATTEAYRWNVPVVTYGFDQSFLDFFGSNGVRAVEAAIQVINNLPAAASSLALTNYPDASMRENYGANAEGLLDLKSATLSTLVEQLGLAQPTRYTCSIRRWDDSLRPFAYAANAGPPWPTGAVPNLLVERNFDPVTLQPSYSVNAVLYAVYLRYAAIPPTGVPSFMGAVAFQVDPVDIAFTAVADKTIMAASSQGPASLGMFYTGLTYDDVGGFKFLLSTNNLRFESLLLDVQSANTNSPIVRTALRPGVDKVVFSPQPFGQAGFLPLTNSYFDTYYLNGIAVTQAVERVTEQPDFLFCAGDTGASLPVSVAILRTGTTNWINNAAINGDPNGLGPGVIAPLVRILFHKRGSLVFSGETSPVQVLHEQWGSFDQSTNLPVSYPNYPAGSMVPLSLRLRLEDGPNLLLSRTWSLPVPIGGTALIETSTNLTAWLPLVSVTNNGAVVEWYHYAGSTSQRFFRVTH